MHHSSEKDFKQKRTLRSCYRNTIFLRFIDIKNFLSNKCSKTPGFFWPEPWKIGLDTYRFTYIEKIAACLLLLNIFILCCIKIKLMHLFLGLLALLLWSITPKTCQELGFAQISIKFTEKKSHCPQINNDEKQYWKIVDCENCIQFSCIFSQMMWCFNNKNTCEI
jgi:hypothetical protein